MTSRHLAAFLCLLSEVEEVDSWKNVLALNSLNSKSVFIQI